MSPDDVLRAQIDSYRLCVEVNKHFNEIEWKMRSVAFTLVAAIISAAGFASAHHLAFDIARIDFGFGHLEGHRLSLATGLLLGSLIIWVMFYAMDVHGYHKLLTSSVDQAKKLQREVRKFIPEFGVTLQISDASPSRHRWWPHWRGWTDSQGTTKRIRWPWQLTEVHSTERVKALYLVAGLGQLALAYMLRLK
jgi:hypothetical protein